MTAANDEADHRHEPAMTVPPLSASELAGILDAIADAADERRRAAYDQYAALQETATLRQSIRVRDD